MWLILLIVDGSFLVFERIAEKSEKGIILGMAARFVYEQKKDIWHTR